MYQGSEQVTAADEILGMHNIGDHGYPPLLAGASDPASSARLSPLPTRSEPSLFAGSEGGLDAVPDIQLPEYLLNVRLDGVLA
jgi:hypothetical protein